MNRSQILNEAGRLIHNDRAAVYGDNRTNHQRIANLWSVVLGIEVQPEQVAICMALLKIARLVQTGSHEDSYVDAAAYMALAGEMATSKTETRTATAG